MQFWNISIPSGALNILLYRPDPDQLSQAFWGDFGCEMQCVEKDCWTGCERGWYPVLALRELAAYGCLIHRTADSLTWIIPSWERLTVLCIVGCLAASLASTH